MLQVDGEHRLVQSAAILRYVAKLGDLYPSDPLIAAKVDAALDQEVDAFTGATVASYTVRFGIEMNNTQVEKAAALLSSEVMPRHLQAIETQLEESETGWIAGTPAPSPADFAWACRLGEYMPMKDRLFTAELRSLEAFPACKRFVSKFYSLPAVVSYYDAAKSK